jgi:hypothetical protein
VLKRKELEDNKISRIPRPQQSLKKSQKICVCCYKNGKKELIKSIRMQILQIYGRNGQMREAKKVEEIHRNHLWLAKLPVLQASRAEH